MPECHHVEQNMFAWFIFGTQSKNRKERARGEKNGTAQQHPAANESGIVFWFVLLF
eukprot:CAMPEP_0168784828 /NCGR_PEP_ID=MMETSP0725-20121227/10425_1 /TAXON_ID=265536 /ORGANISM="Amphiprora sp., Strain CCMP467" /LENGTH=55 /DNA_ID=CAMNT_0008834893 /DNA_START=96 /DNA_END=260 /DNA_ORIENTATION=-